MKRLKLAAPILVVYWLVLASGLTFYSLLRGNAVVVQPLLYGAIVGTIFGHVFALRDFRPWLIIVIVSFVVCWALGFDGGTTIWMAFAPAVLCGYWSLGDRTSLVAFWYPAMIWMLSILDQTNGVGALESSGIGLVVALAFMYVVFLRVRESRRVRLWRTVAYAPLATPGPTTILKEPPGRQLARAGWIVLVGSLACGLTAWIAPQLWHAESYQHHEARTAASAHIGLACCPIVDDVTLRRVRVKEYMNLGRGHDDEITSHRRESCHVCGRGQGGYTSGFGAYVATGRGDPYTTGGPYGPGVSTNAQSITRDYGYASTSPTLESVASRGADYGESFVARPYVPPPPVPTPPLIARDPPAPIAAPPVAPPPPPTRDLAPAPTQNAPSRQATWHSSAPLRDSPDAAPATIAERSNHAGAATVLRILALLVGIALAAQLVMLVLRPLRRWITLRHLRRPFWSETVDQRISNSWQLALVGLRDAGWRTGSGETPRELARRVGVAGVESCAVILERARHGIGIDAGDLDAMRADADVAYRSARSRIGWFSRAIAATRWPLA